MIVRIQRLGLCRCTPSFRIAPWVLSLGLLAACGDLVNPPPDEVHLAQSQTYTNPFVAGGDTARLVLTLVPEETEHIVQVRVWSLGPLAGIEATLHDMEGNELWEGTSAGTELLIPAVKIAEPGEYRLNVRWIQGDGLANYHYRVLYDGPALVETSSNISMTSARTGHSSAGLPDGSVLITGGDASGGNGGLSDTLPMETAAIMEPITGASADLTDMKTARAYHTATWLDTSLVGTPGGVIIIGGIGADGAALETSERFDPNTQMFATGPKMPSPRAFHAAMAVTGTASFLDGKVVLVGGEHSRSGPQHDYLEGLYTEIDENPRALLYFDPDANTFQSFGTLTHGRVLPSVSLLADGRLLIIGGGVDSLPSEAGCSVGTQGDTTCYCTSSAIPLCTLFNCKGAQCTYTNYTRKDLATDVVEVYDTKIGSLTTLDARLNRGRLGHTAAVVPGGWVVIAGGATGFRRHFGPDERGLTEFPKTLDSVEIFDPYNNEFRILPPLAFPREGHRTAVLQDGSALLLGGLRGVPGTTAPVAAVERFDPFEQRFTVVDVLASPRAGLDATLLLDGSRVLVTGGISLNGEVLRTAEIVAQGL